MPEPRPTFPKRQRVPREHVVKIRLSEAERQRLRALAEASDYTLAALLRDQFGKMTIRNRADEKRRNEMLKRINSNLNMIARWVNTLPKRGRRNAGDDASGSGGARSGTVARAVGQVSDARRVLQIRQGRRP
jgi:hypothetical protein